MKVNIIKYLNDCLCSSWFLHHFFFFALPANMRPFKIHFFFFLNLFIFGCVGSSLLCVGFLQLQRVEVTLHCGAGASHCGAFSCYRAQGLGARASVVVARQLSSCGSWVLERRLSTCGARAQLLRGMQDLPGPGLKPMSPALAGGFLTTVPPGKP